MRFVPGWTGKPTRVMWYYGWQATWRDNNGVRAHHGRRRRLGVRELPRARQQHEFAGQRRKFHSDHGVPRGGCGGVHAQAIVATGRSLTSPGMAFSSGEYRQPDRGHDQNHQSNDSLNRLYPGLVESHAQSA
jgi:hypothetical protein